MIIPELEKDCSFHDFQTMIWTYYSVHGRSFPWRDTREHYPIFLSELMLQQTQTSRVEPKYMEFLEVFPDFYSLAAANLVDVLALWTGLGYNRRAKYLLQSARFIVDQYSGILPYERDALLQLPGVGPNTAGSLAAFAHNLPVVFIETNIRRVFLHYFFSERDDVPDKEILTLIETTLDQENPREWYYALMDLGAAMKGLIANPNRRSRHYSKQSPFENSQRQLRGRILRLLQTDTEISIQYVAEFSGFPLYRVQAALEALESEGFVTAESGYIRLQET